MDFTRFESSIRRAPLGLLGMICLVVTLERSYFRNHPGLTNSQAASWSYAARQATRDAKPSEILCFGDSLMKFGVLPPVLKAESGRSAYNLAMFAAPTPASYFTLKKAINEGARPSAILFDAAAGLLLEGPASAHRAYPWADLIGFADAIDLGWTSKDLSLMSHVMMGRLLHSYKCRHEIRSHILATLRGEVNHRSMELTVQERNWKVNQGAQAQAAMEFVEPSSVTQGLIESNWRPNPVNRIYLRRFFELALTHKLPVYWYLPPYSPGEQAQQDQRGESTRYEHFVRTIQREYPKVVVIDGRYSGFGHTEFFDHAHLNRDGGIASTQAIGRLLLDQQGRSNPRTWITLRKTEPGSFPIEDSTQSIAAVKQILSRLRR